MSYATRELGDNGMAHAVELEYFKRYAVFEVSAEESRCGSNASRIRFIKVFSYGHGASPARFNADSHSRYC